MKRTLIKKAFELTPDNQELLIQGWVRTRRDSKEFSFIEISDGSTMKTLQAVADKNLPNYASDVLRLTTGSSISARGTLAPSPAKGQDRELKVTVLQLHVRADDDYPLQKKRHSFEFLRDIAHLRPRTNTLGAILRLRNALSFAIHKFFQDRDFFYVHTPIISAGDCEGAGQLFRVTCLDPDAPPKIDGRTDFEQDFFGQATFLTVSGQLQGEALALALSNIYTFGPTFRAENSNTSRHLAEFWMVEPEMSFCTLDGDAELAEDFIKFVFQYALDNCADDLDFFAKFIDSSVLTRLDSIVASSFERVTYTEAIDLLTKSKNNFEFPVAWGADLQSEHERFLTESLFQKPVIVTDYPAEIKAFYMRLNDDEKTVRAMDVLVPKIGEIIGGSEREDRHDVLRDRMIQHGLNVQDYWWYLDLRKYGGVPHSGFGLGFERLVQYVSGMENIRDVIPFPRTPRHAHF